MPLTELEAQIIEYPMAKLGVNLHKNIVELSPEECLLAKNLVWRNGMVKRGGQTLLNTTQVISSKKITGLTRFYYGTSKLRIIACDTKVVKDDEDNTWTDIKIGLTTGLQTYMNPWGALDRLYIANGTDRAFHYNGTNVIDSVTSTLTVNSQPTSGQNSEVDITINGTINTGVEGTDWAVGVDTDATATNIASWINGISNVSAAASTNVVTVTPAATTDIEAFKWDYKGTDTAAMATVSHFAAPAKSIQFLSYQDRLLTIDANNTGDLRWFKSFDDTELELRSNTGVRPDTYLYGMIIHSTTNVSAGYEAKVLLAGANGMYLFSATDMRPPFTQGDYTIYSLSINVGCNVPRTMVWTPKGSIWLGIDRQIYLLPFESSTPIPIGTKIQSNQDENGLENIPQAQIENACAVYHDGFYKIAVARSGQTTNNAQWWIDINRLRIDDDGHYGPWYGPMLGQTISVFANQNGPGDNGQLIAGEGTAKGYIYELDVSGVYSDRDPATANAPAKLIEVIYKTYYNPLGALGLKKDVHKMEIEMLDINASVNIDFHDITGSVKIGDSLSLVGGALLWDGSFNWDSKNWSGILPMRQVLDISPAISSRRLAILIKSASVSANFELYALRAQVLEQRQIFA